MKLEVLASRVGIQLSPYGSGRNPREEAACDRLFSMRRWLFVGEDSWEPPPADVRLFLEQYAVTIREIEDVLLGSEPVVWERDLDKLYAAPMPSSYGLGLLNWILLVRTLDHAGAGRTGESVRTLEAAFRLNETLSDRPETLMILVSIQMIEKQLRVVRSIGLVGDEWFQRVSSHSYRDRVVDSYQQKLWMFLQLRGEHLCEELRGRDDDAWWYGWPCKPLALALDSYVRLCAAATSEAGRTWITEGTGMQLHNGSLRGTRNWCRPRARAFGDMPYGAKWNVFPGIGLPRLWSNEATRADLNAELALQVLELKALRTESPGQLSAEKLSPRESDVCDGFQWLYDVTSEGVRISLSERPFFVQERNDDFPLSYTVRH